MSARPPKPALPVVVLAPEQEVVRDDRDKLDARIAKLRDELHELMRNSEYPQCSGHVFSILGEVRESDWFWNEYAKEWHLNASVYCVICREYGGWYCPANPTLHCEYENGDYDQCDHCGHPDERK